MTLLILTMLALSMIGPFYALAMGTVVRHFSPRPAWPDGEGKIVIALVPCLNEGTVVIETIRKLHLVDPNLIVMVVDDGSDDETPDVLATINDDRVYVVTRVAPNCRQGKGAALNYGLNQINTVIADLGIDSHNVIVAVFDADGEADSNTMDAVRPWFSDPGVGAVQVGVRINNRKDSRLARMQDVEFAAYTEIFQYGRNTLTSTGLGGNGQFVRLSALQSLGEDPWSDCLTEDLDLGVRLRLAGWHSVFDGSVAVHQQGLHQMSKLIRQRTRWFQGHLQSWDLLPKIWKSQIPLTVKLDISSHLILPVVMLLVSVGILASLVRVLRFAIFAPDVFFTMLTDGPVIPWWYLLGFIATPLVAIAYWRAEPSIGFFRGLLLAHVYTAYSWVWFPAGWRAVWRQINGSAGWAKTARTDDSENLVETGLASTSQANELSTPTLATTSTQRQRQTPAPAPAFGANPANGTVEEDESMFVLRFDGTPREAPAVPADPVQTPAAPQPRSQSQSQPQPQPIKPRPSILASSIPADAASFKSKPTPLGRSMPFGKGSVEEPAVRLARIAALDDDAGEAETVGLFARPAKQDLSVDGVDA